MALVVGLISIVAGFNIMSLLITKIQEKKKDLAILRAFGVEKEFIVALILNIASIIGFLGGILGLLFSYGISYYVNKYHLIKVPAEVYLTPYLTIEPSWGNYIGVFLFIILISIISAILPALLALKEDVTQILRNE